MAPPPAGSRSDIVEDLPSRRPHSVVAVIGHPLAASGQFQMATNTRGVGPNQASTVGPVPVDIPRTAASTWRPSSSTPTTSTPPEPTCGSRRQPSAAPSGRRCTYAISCCAKSNGRHDIAPEPPRDPGSSTLPTSSSTIAKNRAHDHEPAIGDRLGEVTRRARVHCSRATA